MDKEKLIEKLKKVYELGAKHEYIKIYEDITSFEKDADDFIEEMAENIIQSFQ